MEPSDILNQLMGINKKFCKQANNLRWQLLDGTFTNTNPNTEKDKWNPSVGWLRSMKPKGKSPYLFFLDIDGRGLDNRMLEASHKLYYALKDIVGIKPVMKASGRFGIHLYLMFWFPNNWTEEHIWKKMRDLSYTAYINAKLKQDGFLFGMLKKEGLPEDCPGFIDARVYRDGMCRGFSIHPTSRLYSVPYTIKDDLPTINRRMRLQEPMPRVDFKAKLFNPFWELEDYKQTETFTHENIPRDVTYLREMVDEDYKGDKIYKSLPPIFQAIVRMKDDVSHDLKVALVSHIAFYFPMLSGDDISEWIWKKCRWIDLDDWPTTSYQCNYTKNWVDSHKGIRNLFGFADVDKIPLKGIFYEESSDTIK